jgi:hypothetical protein
MVVGIAVAVAISGCSSPERPLPVRDVRIGDEVVLAQGEDVRVDGAFRIGFTRVIEDSRCPSRSFCLLPGDGAVELALAFGTGPSYPDTVHTTLEPKSTVAGDYAVTLVDLMPYPDVPGTIPADEYAVRLRIAYAVR